LESINNCLVYGSGVGSLIESLNISDTNSTLKVVLNWSDNMIDTSVMKFDKFGRLVNIKSHFEECNYSYKENEISKEILSNYPSLYGDCRDSIKKISFFLNKNKLIDSISLSCRKENSSLFLKYEDLQIGKLVTIRDNKNKVLFENIFMFNKLNEYFQWEIITNHNILFRFRKNKYDIKSIFELDDKYEFIKIENISFKNNKTKEFEDVYPGRYSFFDMCGNVLGTISIIK
jgi:hypothetical protein